MAAHANIGETEPVRLPPLLKCAKNFHGEPVRFDIEETGEGHRAFVYGFIGETQAELGVRRAADAFNGSAIFPRFGDEGETSSPQGFHVNSVNEHEDEVIVRRKLIGPAIWRVEIEGAISRAAEAACDMVVYYANPSEIAPRMPPPHKPSVRQCACGISGRG